MRVLVTGADGFVGGHLCRELEAHGHQVVAAPGPQALGPWALDITVPQSVERVVEQSRPEGVIHLAGQSSVAQSHENPGLAFQVNALGTAHLLSALRARSPHCRVVLVGSGEVYGVRPQGSLATEDSPLQPSSPYGASKVAAEVVGLQFWRSYRLPVVAARPFNHLGPGQQPQFVVPSFAAQLAAIRRGTLPPLLKTGNLDPVRDFSHVLDVVSAYRLLLEAGEPGQSYNVASGVGRSIQALLGTLLSLSGVDAQVELDPARLRPVEIPWLVGDAGKLRTLGWVPQRTVEDALTDVLREQGALGST